MDPSRFIRVIQDFADNILRYGRPYKVPLFIDQLDPNEDEQRFCLLSRHDEAFVLSNLACQQELFRMLTGLTLLTGDERYMEAAKDAVSYALGHFSDSAGLLCWGGHAAIALPMEEVAYERGKGVVHELKCTYPYYDLMWQVDEGATKRFIEAFWNAHVIDWTILDFDRHGIYRKPRGKIWLNSYSPKSVFFWGRGLTFVNTGSDLYYAAGVLAHLSGEEEPLVWSKRLAYRYTETRQAGIGISGYQFSQRADSWCNGPEVKGDRAQYQYAPYLPEGHLVYEGTLFRPLPQVQRCQLYLGELLGGRGEELQAWALEEMTAWARVAYRKEDNSFVPLLTDGYSLEGFMIQRDGYFGPKGRVESARFANADFLWMYALGYRISQDRLLWQVIRSIAAQNGLGEIGEADCGGLDLRTETSATDYQLIYSLLELYRSTGHPDFLRTAAQIAENMISDQYCEGWLTTNGRRVVNSSASLAILKLAETMTGNGIGVSIGLS